MAFTIIRFKDQEAKMKGAYQVKERTFVTLDGKKISKLGDGNRRYLLAPAGGFIPMEQAVALGLVKAKDQEAKASAPTMDKSSKPKENKGKK